MSKGALRKEFISLRSFADFGEGEQCAVRLAELPAFHAARTVFCYASYGSELPTDAILALCRREGKKLFLKGDRCLTDKCALSRRATVPGQHGAGRKTVKEYGMQLREKQTARRYYGVQEGQFETYYEMADKKEGIAGENLLSILECRLDNIVYRMGLASSRKEARQLVLHEHFELNGKKVNIPSLIVKIGDEIVTCMIFKDNPDITMFDLNKQNVGGADVYGGTVCAPGNQQLRGSRRCGG